MVESQQSIITRMVLPIPPAGTKSRERTSYQLQPTTMHINHSGILPVAALSNFFKAPATPIHSRLPTINISEGSPVFHRSKSIHQRNKCLAEVIQSQLMELKKLQDKYRYQKLESSQTMKTMHRTSISDTTKAIGSHIAGIQQKEDFSRLIASDGMREMKPTLLSPSSRPYVSRSNTKIALTPPKAIPFARKNMPSSLQKRLSPDKLEVIPTAKISENTQESQLDKSEEQQYSSVTPEYKHTMDPVKFASIANWVQSVEAAQKQKGKCSEVISIANPDRCATPR